MIVQRPPTCPYQACEDLATGAVRPLAHKETGINLHKKAVYKEPERVCGGRQVPFDLLASGVWGVVSQGLRLQL